MLIYNYKLNLKDIFFFFLNFQLQSQGFELPQAITNLIGTTHTFEVKTSTYFEHGAFESFTCWNIVPAIETPMKSVENTKKKRYHKVSILLSNILKFLTTKTLFNVALL